MDDRTKKGRHNPPHGEGHYVSKLTADEVAEIKQSKERTYVLAEKFNVHWNTIADIRRGRTWKDK